MPPKVVRVQPAGGRSRPAQPRGVVGATYDFITAPEYASVVRSVAAFGVGVAFLASSFGEYFDPYVCTCFKLRGPYSAPRRARRRICSSIHFTV
ncbi:hypothetical protein OOU_Y34scaffold00751g5 [Pyricularia oryzae Y34]|uniref:TOM core complex subunit Tom6 n=2 Tax=Pyricularia oryzae TaxID=318829 RepID=A0AA97PHC2_PYRO3|nr:hypothetical protein OOU_Y34scaffold00751g5 [Pyricularia oryzae Y34]